jgi:hypothetical protein
MVRNGLKARLKQAKRHIATQDRYKLYPVYSTLIAALISALSYWPLDMGVIYVWAAHPWIIVLDAASLNVAIWLSLSLGIVGLFRDAWLAKIIAAPGIWISFQIAAVLWFPAILSTPEAMWRRFAAPVTWLVELADGNEELGAMLCACAFAALYFSARPLLRKAFRRVLMLERSSVDRWPSIARFTRPVL